jgi:hypothetical protein
MFCLPDIWCFGHRTQMRVYLGRIRCARLQRLTEFVTLNRAIHRRLR